jgi:hypothetical protein
MDVIIYQHRDGDPAGKGATFDILGDAEGDADPQWGRTKPSGYGDVDKWRRPVDPGGVVDTPPPPPARPSPDKDEVLETLRRWRAELDRLIKQLE